MSGYASLARGRGEPKVASSSVFAPPASGRSTREIASGSGRDLGGFLGRSGTDGGAPWAPFVPRPWGTSAPSVRPGVAPATVPRAPEVHSALAPAGLPVSRPSDAAEREADELALRALAAPAVPRVAATVPAATLPAAGTLPSGGVPLSPGERRFFEPRFGRDFSSVRLHAEGEAAAAARALDAQAFTLGACIAFDAGRYRPESEAGQRLIAHELAHVVQQGMAPPLPGLPALPARTAGAPQISRQANGPSTAAPAASDDQRKADEDRARRRASVHAASASDIERDWASRREDFVAVAEDPTNTLSVRQMGFIWGRYWAEKLNTSIAELKVVDEGLHAASAVAYAENKQKFDMGARGALGAQYQRLADERDAASFMLSDQLAVFQWLEAMIDARKERVTLKRVNEQAAGLARGKRLFQTYMAPIIFGAIVLGSTAAGGGSSSAPGKSGPVEAPKTGEPAITGEAPKPGEPGSAEPVTARAPTQAPAPAQAVAPGQAAKARVTGPQLDVNIVSRILNPKHPAHASAVEFARAHKGATLTVNRHSFQKLLQNFSKDQLRSLRDEYGIRLMREVSLDEIGSAAGRLRRAFQGTDRSISAEDARVAASAFIKGERLATSDLQFFKRARDLGIDVQFVGTGDPAVKAAAYVPVPVQIPDL